MPNLRELSESEREDLRASVQSEFPHDEMMQEIHYARALRAAQFRDFTRSERIEHLNRLLPQSTPSR